MIIKISMLKLKVESTGYLFGYSDSFDLAACANDQNIYSLSGSVSFLTSFPI